MKIALLTTDSREHYKDYQAPEPYFGTAPAALLQGLAQWPEAEVHVLSCTRQPVRPFQQLASRLYFHGLHVPKIGWLRTGYQGCIRAVRRALRAIQPDIVHGQGTERDCALSAVFSGLPNVLTIHGNMRLVARIERSPLFSYGWIAARLERIAIPRSRGVICITRYTQQAVASLARRTWVVPNGVDASFFDMVTEPDDSGTILCVGNVGVRKNQNAFIRALEPLAGECRFRLVFLGQPAPNSSYGNEFEQLVARHPWCEYRGFAGRDSLKAMMKTAALVALPSLEDNCPMVLLEAMAAGVPVVAARVGGVPDLVEDGATGLLCDPLDPVSMRSSVKRLLLDLPAAGALARAARQRALERFHPRIIARRHLEIYREVLSKPS